LYLNCNETNAIPCLLEFAFINRLLFITDKTFTGLDYMSNASNDRWRTSEFTPGFVGGVCCYSSFYFSMLCCLFYYLFVFVLSLVCSMLSVLHQCCQCYINVVSVTSMLSVLHQCCQCYISVHSWLLLQFSLMFISI
jgi:hypothetical protein